jgi:maltooligosyltrehalose trehalohydrolase
MTWKLDLSANCEKSKVNFRIWAPYHDSLSIVLYKDDKREIVEMNKEDKGYFSLRDEDIEYYSYLIQNKEIPDPASKYQLEGVHGRSKVVCKDFDWEDKDWKGVNQNDLIIYELHVGTFSERGDFQGVIEKLDYLKDLGITAIELMPISQFGGNRNWGYDGVFLYAVQNSYGGPYELKRLVNEAHKKGLGVILDVVYNHVGPEGNYLSKFGPYFSSRYTTPWGPIFNYDEAWSDEVRHYVTQNALYWIYEYHIDGLRLDAVHSIYDISPKHILAEISEKIKIAESELQRKINLIAESDLNDPKIISPKEKCGYNIDAQWSDDFHHSLHAYVTGERESYYEDFGSIQQIIKALEKVFVYDGVYSKFRKKTHGAPVGDLGGNKFIVYIQNHDQVGNRKDGKRLLSLIDKNTFLILTTLYFMSPYIPMIFMGEEYGEKNPFLFFTDFSDPQIINALREGRKKELGEYYYDPQSIDTYNKSKLSWRINEEILNFYKNIIKIKKGLDHSRNILVKLENNSIIVEREKLLVIASFGNSILHINKKWKLILSTAKFPEYIDGEIKIGKGAAIYENVN